MIILVIRPWLETKKRRPLTKLAAIAIFVHHYWSSRLFRILVNFKRFQA